MDDVPETRLPKWSMTSNMREGRTPPLANPVMGACSLSEALMAAASLARSPPKPRVELLPSQSEQVPGSVLELVVASTSTSHSMLSAMWTMRHLYEYRHLLDQLCLLMCQIFGKLCLLACQGMPVFIVLTHGVLCCDHLPNNVLTRGFVLAM